MCLSDPGSIHYAELQYLVLNIDFLPFYAILRAIPSKLGGVSAMLGALLIFLSYQDIAIDYSEYSLYWLWYCFDISWCCLMGSYDRHGTNS